MNTATIKQVVAAPTDYDYCYACDKKAVGVTERWANGEKTLVFGCKRHADLTIKVTQVCCYCDGTVRSGSLNLGDGLYAHRACHRDAERQN